MQRAILSKKAEKMKFGDYPKVGSLDGVTGFRNYLQSLGIEMPCDDIVAHGAWAMEYHDAAGAESKWIPVKDKKGLTTSRCAR